MHDRVRFVLVTDDVDFALADVFASSRSNAPSWARVIDDPIEIMALPDGCKVHCAVWCSGRSQSGAEIAWRDRRARGGLVFLSDAEMDKIAEWRTRRSSPAGATAAAPASPEPPAPPASHPLIQQWT